MLVTVWVRDLVWVWVNVLMLETVFVTAGGVIEVVMILVDAGSGAGVRVVDTVTVLYTGEGVAIKDVLVMVVAGRVVVLYEVLAGRVTVFGGRVTVS